jgi:hypothetical protein
MAARQAVVLEEAMRFTWGDSVRVKTEAPAEARPGALAEVVAITEIENERQATKFAAGIGAIFYQIEFGDGVAMELPEGLLEAASK